MAHLHGPARALRALCGLSQVDSCWCSDATGTTRLVAAGDDGAGHSYTVECVVTDSNSNTASSTTSVSKSESTSSGNVPTVDSLSLTEDNGGGSPHADFQIDYTASDGDLDTADLTLTDLDDGETEGSTTVDVSGRSASGTESLRAFQGRELRSHLRGRVRRHRRQRQHRRRDGHQSRGRELDGSSPSGGVFRAGDVRLGWCRHRSQ